MTYQNVELVFLALNFLNYKKGRFSCKSSNFSKTIVVFSFLAVSLDAPHNYIWKNIFSLSLLQGLPNFEEKTVLKSPGHRAFGLISLKSHPHPNIHMNG